ncbi:MAG: hypothetical protein M0P58_11920 [Bacteroidales bacterium]|jgi:hypothetical protein|nr:hypothetical protein [Bacteroidales bacterium]
MKSRLVFLGMVFLFFSCGSPNQNAKNDQKESTGQTAGVETETVQAPKINTDSLVKVIDVEREKIERNLKSLKRTTLTTTNLRAQIKQKWSKIDFYAEASQIVRIKTYPYDKISKRTEEFYFQKGKLILAFIEDEGAQYKGKSDKRVGKTYYFFNDAGIKEINQTTEIETSIRQSDSERLLQEAKEYIELFPKK